MNQTLTKSIKAELRGFADRITPPEPAPGAVPGKPLTAEQLQQQYGITTDKAGKPLTPGQLYLAKDLPAVNHLRRLCRAFEVGGWDQVERYLQPYRTPEAIARQAAELHPMAATLQPAEGWALTTGGAAELELQQPEVREFTKMAQRWEKDADEAEQRRQHQQLQQLMPLANLPDLPELSAGRVCGAECGAVVCPCEGSCK